MQNWGIVMAETDKDFEELEQFFAEARQGTGQVPGDLMQAILADADRVQAGFFAVVEIAPTSGKWAQLRALLGGWPTFGGLAAACAAGVWIGLAPPSFLPDPAQFVTGSDTDIDLIGMGELTLALSEEG